MDVTFLDQAGAEAVAYLVNEDEIMSAAVKAADEATQGAISKAIEYARFSGKAGQVVELIAPQGLEAKRVLVAGLGKADKVNDRSWEKAAAGLVKRLQTSGALGLDIVGATDADAAARIGQGARLAAYRFDGYRTTMKDEQKPTLTSVGIVASDVDAAKAAFGPLNAAADGTYEARDLVNEPPNVLHPESYADRIVKLSELGLEIEVLGEAEMDKLGMHSMLGVGQGSVKESRLVVIKWMGGADKDAAPVALVGKGVTFDTGGISLKPGAGMEEMKGDMGGSAAVVGAMVALAKRKAKANVIGFVGLVENMPDGNAQRPGDIVTTAAGKTIEIQNTDAEGRLVLVDVLWYAQEHYQPRAIVDLATLTGAIIISLGHENAGLFTNNDDLAEELAAAGKAEGEPVWRLPLGPGYDKLIDSKFADMKNIGGRSAGSITAAQFLQRFIKNDTPWAHIDIAGTAWRPSNGNPMEPSWASGYGPRLLDRWVRDNYED